MLIDWFTVAAQALNFIILVWLMKRFLYRPILHAIDVREERIAAELAAADATQAEAREERVALQHKIEALDQRRATLLKEATDAASAERKRLVEEARQAAEQLASRRDESLRRDAHELSQTIRRQTRAEVFAIARKALADLASESLEVRIVEVFVRRLGEMDGDAIARLGEALKTAAEPALVRSAFHLPGPQRAAIQRALNEAFATEVQVQFETGPSLIGGIELSANGQKVAWSISDYLGSLEKRVGALVNKPVDEQVEAGRDPVVAPAAEAQEAP